MTLLTLVNKANLLPQLHNGLCSAVLWITPVRAAGLRRHKPCPSQRAWTCHHGFPKATQEPPHSLLPYQCQQSASHPTSFPYHAFSISVWQIMKCISAVLSQVSVWGIKRRALQWAEVLWPSSGAAVCTHRCSPRAAAVRLLLRGGERSEEVKLLEQETWKAFCWAQGWSEGASSGRQQVRRDSRVTEPLLMPQSSLFACAPILSFWDDRRGWGGAPSPQHSLVLPPLCLHSRGSSSQEKGGADPGCGGLEGILLALIFSGEFSVSRIIFRRKALFSAESHLLERWKNLHCTSSFWYENSLQKYSLEITVSFDFVFFHQLVLGGRRKRRTTTRKSASLQESTGGSFCFQCPNSSVCSRCCVFMLALTLLLRNSWRTMVKTIQCTQMSVPHQQDAQPNWFFPLQTNLLLYQGKCTKVILISWLFIWAL